MATTKWRLINHHPLNPINRPTNKALPHRPTSLPLLYNVVSLYLYLRHWLSCRSRHQKKKRDKKNVPYLCLLLAAAVCVWERCAPPPMINYVYPSDNYGYYTINFHLLPTTTVAKRRNVTTSRTRRTHTHTHTHIHAGLLPCYFILSLLALHLNKLYRHRQQYKREEQIPTKESNTHNIPPPSTKINVLRQRVLLHVFDFGWLEVSGGGVC